MKRELRMTSDGSKTIYLPELDETYHSIHGALQEARHVFIKNGLQRILNKNQISIFEMGFGTGLNAFLTMIEATKSKQTIFYTGIEAFPVSLELLDEIDYASIENKDYSEIYREMHECTWNEEIQLTPFFNFKKYHQKIEEVILENESYDLIYFDAFGPRVQEDLWGKQILAKMLLALKKDGILVTYCAKGQVKRDLKELGFEVSSVPGPPGKREMTIAKK